MAHLSFERALKLYPKILYAGLDLVGQHFTISDLRFAAQHELDLADEGDITLSTRDRNAIKTFLKKTEGCI